MAWRRNPFAQSVTIKDDNAFTEALNRLNSMYKPTVPFVWSDGLKLAAHD